MGVSFVVFVFVFIFVWASRSSFSCSCLSLCGRLVCHFCVRVGLCAVAESNGRMGELVA